MIPLHIQDSEAGIKTNNAHTSARITQISTDKELKELLKTMEVWL